MIYPRLSERTKKESVITEHFLQTIYIKQFYLLSGNVYETFGFHFFQLTMERVSGYIHL